MREASKMLWSVVCFDEFGPIQVKPQPGSAWTPQNNPVRHRATYRRFQGVSHFLSAYDVHEDVLWMHHKKRKRWQEVLSFFKAIRRRYPDQRKLFIVLDNMRTHLKKEVLEWCRTNNVEARVHCHQRLVDEPNRVPLRTGKAVCH